MQLRCFYLQFLKGLADQCTLLTALYEDNDLVLGVALEDIH